MSKPIKIDGQLVDMPPAVRCFERYDHHARSLKMASHTQGFRQREAVGEFYYTHPFVPDRAFATRGAALRAALATLSSSTPASRSAQE